MEAGTHRVTGRSERAELFVDERKMEKKEERGLPVRFERFRNQTSARLSSE